MDLQQVTDFVVESRCGGRDIDCRQVQAGGGDVDELLTITPGSGNRIASSNRKQHR